jgi:hypothetical protein
MKCLWVSYKKKKGKKINFFCILKASEEKSRIRSWIRILHTEMRIRIRIKMSRIPNTGSVKLNFKG